MRNVKNNVRSGQILLITVLVLSIAITIVLSLIGRGVTDIGTSRQLEESARAFSAAEAGIEAMLSSTEATILDSEIGYSATQTSIGGSLAAYTLPYIQQGQVGTVWLVDHDTSNTFNDLMYYSGTLDICWEQSAISPALEFIVYYKNVSTGLFSTVIRSAADPDASRAGLNKFSSVALQANVCGGMANAYRHSLSISQSGEIPYMLRIRPYYASARVTIAPQNPIPLPLQGIEITSTGTTQGGVTRKIVVKREYQSPSSLFDYAVYSQSSFMQ